MNRWSHAEGDIVDVDEIDYGYLCGYLCCYCGAYGEHGGFTDDDEDYCPDCFEQLFVKE
jgi:hypothetical protein